MRNGLGATDGGWSTGRRWVIRGRPTGQLWIGRSPHGYFLVTRDLDFGTLLALTEASGPSAVQVRTQDVLPDHLETLLVPALKQTQPDLEQGALVTVREDTTRVRVLPIRRG